MLSTLWNQFPLKTGHSWLNWLLLLAPVAIVLELAHAPAIVVFLAAALAIAPLAGVLGEATNALAMHSGPAVGGMLNATLGNATELIIAIFAIRAGHISVVKASLTGSILGNLLLVLGLSIVAGGSRRQTLRFSRTAAASNSTMLMIAAAGLVMPAIFALTVFGDLEHHENVHLQQLSLWTAGVLVLLYLSSLLFMFKTHHDVFRHAAHGEAAMPAQPASELPSRRRAVWSLLLATAIIAVLSEILVEEIGPVTHALGMTEFFVGVIVVALVGNAAEHSTAILMAMEDKMDLAMTVASGSSTQIALFVAPVLVFLSVALGHPMTLVFNGFEIAGIFLSVVIVSMISSDGETNWFEGAQLLALYAIMAVAFWFVHE
jgi:Ca2+:H+ antiporter